MRATVVDVSARLLAHVLTLVAVIYSGAEASVAGRLARGAVNESGNFTGDAAVAAHLPSVRRIANVGGSEAFHARSVVELVAAATGCRSIAKTSPAVPVAKATGDVGLTEESFATSVGAARFKS